MNDSHTSIRNPLYGFLSIKELNIIDIIVCIICRTGLDQISGSTQNVASRSKFGHSIVHDFYIEFYQRSAPILVQKMANFPRIQMQICIRVHRKISSTEPLFPLFRRLAQVDIVEATATEA